MLRVEGSGFDEFRVRIKVPLSGFRVWIGFRILRVLRVQFLVL